MNPFDFPLNLNPDSLANFERNLFFYRARHSVNVTTAFTLTPGKFGYLQIIPDAARTSDTTTAINNGSYSGQILVLEGTNDTNTATIKDNANTKMAGDCVLGINDTLTLVWNDADWVEIARSNN